jgi:hypothetical protein
MKKSLFFLYFVLISACQPLLANPLTVTPTVLPTTNQAKIDVTNTPLPTKTFTPEHSETPTPSGIPTLSNPKFFNPSSVQTFTPAPPAQCPKENPSLEFNGKMATDFSESNLNLPQRHEHYIDQILSYLNSGGKPESTVEEEYIDRHVQDLTGDSVPELISTFVVWLDVFGCKNGRYELLFSGTYESSLYGVYIIEIADLNINGLPEIVVYFDGCFGGKCPIVRVYEWDGQEFKNLMTNSCNAIEAPFEIKIQDIDDNGTKEIIFQNEGNQLPDGLYGFPYRAETLICMWNGKSFDVYKYSFGAPYYRFQAVQDGDAETLAGDYPKALDLYQEVIFDKSLEWFTSERNLHQYWVYMAKRFQPQPTPTASPNMKPDPNEYPNLAAYALYRIMLLHVLQNNMPDAELTLNTLQKEYPFDKPGGYFSQMAFIFWKEYQTSRNIQQACSVTISYAAQYPDRLIYLGDSERGMQHIEYTPGSVCPFK